MGLWTPGLPSMPLTEREKEVLLQEAEKAKEMGYCLQVFRWLGGAIRGVRYEIEVNQDELKARLDPDPTTHEILARGGKPLTKRQTGV